MRIILAAWMGVLALAGTGCVNLYEKHFEPDVPTSDLRTGSPSMPVQVISVPFENHSARAAAQDQNATRLGQSRFVTETSVRGDLEDFARKIGSDVVLSSRRFDGTHTRRVTRYHRLHNVRITDRDGKYRRVEGIEIPYEATEEVDYFEYWATFFRKGRGPVAPPEEKLGSPTSP